MQAEVPFCPGFSSFVRLQSQRIDGLDEFLLSLGRNVGSFEYLMEGAKTQKRVRL